VKKQAEDHLTRLNSLKADLNMSEKREESLSVINSSRKRQSKGGRNILDEIAVGGETADDLLENVPADILLDTIRILLRNDVALLFSKSRDDGSLVLTIYQDGQKRFIIPRSAADFVARMETILLQLG